MIFNNNILRILFTEDTDSFFISYFFSSKIGWTKLKRISKNTTSVGAIYSKDLLNVKMAVPPLQEQQKIAEILTTIDDKISSIEEKIQQTQQLKKGLIGRIPKSWSLVKVGDVYKKSGELGNKSFPIASISISKGIVRREFFNRQLISNLPPEKHLLVKKGYLAYNMMRMWQGASDVADFDCIVSPAYIVCEPIIEVFPKYTMYYFKSPKIILLLKRFSKGITEDRWRLYFNDFSKIPFILPTYNEQKKISTILSTVDNKLDTHQAKKTSYETLKKGLMEQLLTGERRVKL